jgi:hypothetical protein
MTIRIGSIPRRRRASTAASLTVIHDDGWRSRGSTHGTPSDHLGGAFTCATPDGLLLGAGRIEPSMLCKLRDYERISQTNLAELLNQVSGSRWTQKDISLLERGGTNRALQLELSRHFRRLGHDADGAGSTLYVALIQP